MTIHNDFVVRKNGNIRYVGCGESYNITEFYQYLINLSDDLLDITSHVPIERVTPDIMRLTNNYNINDYASIYLYGGTIIQGENDTEEVYNGLIIVGFVNNPKTNISIIQNNKVYDIIKPGHNGDYGESGIIARYMVKSKTKGELIDDGKLIVRAIYPGDTFSEYIANMNCLGNVYIAIFTQPDLLYSVDTIYDTDDVYVDENKKYEFIKKEEMMI